MTAEVVELFTKMGFPPVNGSNGEQLAYQAWELYLRRSQLIESGPGKDTTTHRTTDMDNVKLDDINEGLAVCRNMLELLQVKRPGEYIKFTNTFKMLAFEHAEDEVFIKEFS